MGQEYSRANFEEKLTENHANDHLKVVVTEKQRTETPSEKSRTEYSFLSVFLNTLPFMTDSLMTAIRI